MQQFDELFYFFHPTLICARVFNNQHITCSWHQKTKPQIFQLTNLKCCKEAREALKDLFNGVLFLISYFKKHAKPCFFILKSFCSTLNSWIGEWEILWFRFFMSRTGYMLIVEYSRTGKWRKMIFFSKLVKLLEAKSLRYKFTNLKCCKMTLKWKSKA